MEARPGLQIIQAVVPLAEMFGYATGLAVAPLRAAATTRCTSHTTTEVPKSIGEEVIARVSGTSRR